MNETPTDLHFDAPRMPDAALAPEFAPPTRAEGLQRLRAFTPEMGQRYAGRRNFDLPASARDNVSQLSPWVRRRLVFEEELVAAALGAHGANAAEKFIQEVFWRGYWKGWLEMRPSVWTAYRTRLAEDRAGVDAQALREAEAGETGIACFDHWARELAETGYLHNHARMWFASIWIFTLDLPWRLGADFFLRHLLDGDPASNTLGWRWVAGLHTRGKHYVADAGNIARYTEGRFRPGPRDLAPAPQPLYEDEETPPPSAPPLADRLDPARSMALLITEEDMAPETCGLDLGAMRGAATLQLSGARSDAPVSALVRAFDRAAFDDAATRACAAGAPEAERLVDIAPPDLARWAQRVGAEQIVTPWVSVGPVRDWLDAAQPALDAAGVRVVMTRRRWDDAVQPHATAGFFKLKKKIPALLRALN